jgi:hypothetical protein
MAKGSAYGKTEAGLKGSMKMESAKVLALSEAKKGQSSFSIGIGTGHLSC